MSTSTILKPIAEIQVSAWPEFDSRVKCVPGFRKKGPEELKITWFQETFYEYYLGILLEMNEAGKQEKRKLDKWLIERDVPARTIIISELLVGARDSRIIGALDPDNTGAHLISLAHYFEILNRHPNGEYVKGELGGIRVNHYDNLAYILDRNSEPKSVTSDFFKTDDIVKGYQVKSDPIDQPDENEADAADRLGSWRAGDYVFYYKPQA